MRAWSHLIGMARGVWLLRNPLLVKRMGDWLRALNRIEQLRAQNPGAFIADDVVLHGWPQGQLLVGAGSRIEQGNVLALGDELNGFGQLTIGTNSWVGQYNNFRAAGDASIRIGNDCLISQFCTFAASNHATRGAGLMRSAAPAPGRRGVTVGDGAWIGAGAVILPGVRIGTGAVVGAGSVVTRDVPDFEIWGGHPAARIGDRLAQDR